MKLSKRIFWISTVMSIITLVGSIIFSFCIEKNNVTEYINGILLNIFAGTIVLGVTSIYEYTTHKIELLEKIMMKCIKFCKIFSEIEYIDERKYALFNSFKAYYENQEYDEKAIKELYDIYTKEYESNKKKKFEKAINKYIQIGEAEYNDFWDCYANLDFIFDLKRTKKNKLYNELFYYIYYDKISKIREKSFHFKEYKNAKNGNYFVNLNMLYELQKNIFSFEEKPYNQKLNTKVENRELGIVSNEFDNIRQTHCIVINNVIEHINDMHNYVRLLAYGKNKKEDKK